MLDGLSVLWAGELARVGRANRAGPCRREQVGGSWDGGVSAHLFELRLHPLAVVRMCWTIHGRRRAGRGLRRTDAKQRAGVRSAGAARMYPTRARTGCGFPPPLPVHE